MDSIERDAIIPWTFFFTKDFIFTFALFTL
jgi:hypothetical protein